MCNLLHKVSDVQWSDKASADETKGEEPPCDLRELRGGVVVVSRPPIPLRRRFRSLSSRPVVDGVTQTFQVNLLED